MALSESSQEGSRMPVPEYETAVAGHHYGSADQGDGIGEQVVTRTDDMGDAKVSIINATFVGHLALLLSEEPQKYPRKAKWLIALVIAIAAVAAPFGSAVFFPEEQQLRSRRLGLGQLQTSGIHEKEAKEWAHSSWGRCVAPCWLQYLEGQLQTLASRKKAVAEVEPNVALSRTLSWVSSRQVAQSTAKWLEILKMILIDPLSILLYLRFPAVF
ncbi:MFS multidrug resistance transporter [Histoplasma capsulatum H143]|uniref:MFS multidrug resistance transporter n=1 Tax=Ajellomyces capsulatus (strain H143) TaxID=544712 RepID=C6H2B7_AJECH|nr:MFS multidrug resistance transporter [Histoplasma capsulatum H143]